MDRIQGGINMNHALRSIALEGEQLREKVARYVPRFTTDNPGHWRVAVQPMTETQANMLLANAYRGIDGLNALNETREGGVGFPSGAFVGEAVRTHYIRAQMDALTDLMFRASMNITAFAVGGKREERSFSLTDAKHDMGLIENMHNVLAETLNDREQAFTDYITQQKNAINVQAERLSGILGVFHDARASGDEKRIRVAVTDMSDLVGVMRNTIEVGRLYESMRGIRELALWLGDDGQPIGFDIAKEAQYTLAEARVPMFFGGYFVSAVAPEKDAVINANIKPDLIAKEIIKYDAK